MSNNLNQQEDQEEEQQEIMQPMAVNRHFMFDFEETELEHPRRT